MVVIKHYSDTQLETVKFSRLGALYMTAFNLVECDAKNIPELERLERFMKGRSLDERLELLRFMESDESSQENSENYERAVINKRMIKRFYDNVLL